MKTAIAASLVAATVVLAAPVEAEVPAALEKRVPATNIDATVLQFALTLEHLERAFYRDGLNKYNAAAFAKAGFEPWVRRRVTEIASHEKNHVDFLTAGLKEAGANPVAECVYAFPDTDPKSFMAVSQILEGVGTSAYLGAATLITNPEYLTAAGSILTVEARHTAWIRSAVNKGDAFPAPYDTPLDPTQVYTLAASFIKSCPSSNEKLPFTPFPALTASASKVSPGGTVKLSYSGASSSDFVVFYSGLETKAVQYNSNGVKIPDGYLGQVYAVIASSAEASDDNIKAGPVIVEVPFSPARDVNYS